MGEAAHIALVSLFNYRGILVIDAEGHFIVNAFLRNMYLEVEGWQKKGLILR